MQIMHAFFCIKQRLLNIQQLKPGSRAAHSKRISTLLNPTRHAVLETADPGSHPNLCEKHKLKQKQNCLVCGAEGLTWCEGLYGQSS